VGRLVNHTFAQTGVNLRWRNTALLHSLPGVRLNEYIACVLRQLTDDAQHVGIVDGQGYGVLRTRNCYGFIGCLGDSPV